MANLFNNDIGLNYKGLINIGSTINQNVSASLQSLTDGDGNNLPIQVGTGLVSVDGGTIAFSTGTNARNVLSQTYTINNTGGTNTVRGIYLNATETSVTGTTHNLMELQVGGVSRYTLEKNGLFTIIRNGPGNLISLNSGGSFFMRFFTSATEGSITNLGSLTGSGLVFGSTYASLMTNSATRIVVNNSGLTTFGTNASGFTASAMVHVRGDGTNAIFRAEDSAGTARFLVPNSGDITTNSDISIPANNFFKSGTAWFSGINSVASIVYGGTSANGRLGVGTSGVFIDYGGNNKTNTSGTIALATLTSGFAAEAGSANFRPLSINYTLNNSGAQTGTATGIFLNATETALNGMTHNLMDLQVGGQSRVKYTPTASGGFRVRRTDDAYDIVAITNSGVSIHQNLTLAVNYMQAAVGSVIYNTNSLTVGSNSVNSARLHVRGDGTNPIFRFENNAGTNILGLNSSNQILTFNSGTVTTTLEVTSTHYPSIKIIGYTTFVIGLNAVAGAPLFINNSTGTINYMSIGNINGTADHFNTSMGMPFTASSGSTNFDVLKLSNVINQTSTANGITRGLYVNTTLTSATDFRAVDVLTGSTSAHKLIRLANAAGNKVFEVNAAQEIGLFGVTPIAQPTTAIAGATVTPGGGASILEDDLFAGYTVAQIAQALVNIGILKP